MRHFTATAYRRKPAAKLNATTNQRGTFASLRFRTPTRLGFICTVINIRPQCQSAMYDGNDPSSLVLSRQPPRPATSVPSTALSNDANVETPPRALHLQLPSRIAEMQHNTNRQTNAVQKRYRRHHDARGREKNKVPCCSASIRRPPSCRHQLRTK